MTAADTLNVLRLALSLAFLLASVTPALADLTAANAHEDRVDFERCGDASDLMTGSGDTLSAAVLACNKSTQHYAREVESAKDTDTRCRAEIYLGSSAKRFAYVLSKSANTKGRLKVSKFARAVLEAIPADCPGEPNIIQAAKMIEAS
jgi:hypothetical protein